MNLPSPSTLPTPVGPRLSISSESGKADGRGREAATRSRHGRAPAPVSAAVPGAGICPKAAKGLPGVVDGAAQRGRVRTGPRPPARPPHRRIPSGIGSEPRPRPQGRGSVAAGPARIHPPRRREGDFVRKWQPAAAGPQEGRSERAEARSATAAAPREGISSESGNRSRPGPQGRGMTRPCPDGPPPRRRSSWDAGATPSPSGSGGRGDGRLPGGVRTRRDPSPPNPERRAGGAPCR
jgi:hypothetical protein